MNDIFDIKFTLALEQGKNISGLSMTLFCFTRPQSLLCGALDDCLCSSPMMWDNDISETGN